MSSPSLLSPPSPPAPGPSRPGRDGDRTLRAFALLATAATFLLITVGALVRATGSGDGCPGWPKCYGRLVPPFTYHPGHTLAQALIEYSHRLTAFLVFVSIALLAVHAWRRYRSVPKVVRPATAALALWLFQAVLGGLVVKFGLNPLLVTAHLATAMLLAAVLVIATVAVFSVDAVPARPMDPLARSALAAAAGVFLLLAVGAYVRGEGAGLAFTDWPLMNGRAIPTLGSLRPLLMFAHRVLALAVAVLVVALAVRAWRDRRTPRPVAALALAALGLYGAQVLIGASNVWTRLAPAAVTAHVAVAALIWGDLVATAATARVFPGTADTRQPAAIPSVAAP
jgi:heme A synthase